MDRLRRRCSFMRAENKNIINAQTSRRSRRPKMPQSPLRTGGRGKCIAAWEEESKVPAGVTIAFFRKPL